ncbi:MAG: hypothetical protein ACK2UB_12070 [Anaerolineales bacterium]
MQNRSSILRLSLLLSAGLAVSCMCGTPSARIDRNLYKDEGGSPPIDSGSAAQDLPMPTTDEPYRVAAFPSGAAIYLLCPPEDASVSTPWADVVGKAPPDTVITLNDEIAVAGTDGSFSARVPLEVGVNEIQCVASDWEGHEATFSIFIEYIPEE